MHPPRNARPRTGGCGVRLPAGLDAERLSELCARAQHPAAAEPQRLPLGRRGYEGGPGGTLPLADRLHLAERDQLPLVERRRPHQLYGHLRSRGRHDALQRRPAAHGRQAAAAAEPHRRTLGRRGGQRHPHRHRAGLHAVPLCRRGGDGQPQHGRRLESAARPCRGDVAGRLHQPRRLRTAREPVCERRIPGRRGPLDARQLQTPAQAAARTGHHRRDDPRRAGGRPGGRSLPQLPAKTDIYATALESMPEIARGELAVEAAELEVREVRAGLPADAGADGRHRNGPHVGRQLRERAPKSGTASTKTSV